MKDQSVMAEASEGLFSGNPIKLIIFTVIMLAVVITIPLVLISATDDIVNDMKKNSLTSTHPSLEDKSHTDLYLLFTDITKIPVDNSTIDKNMYSDLQINLTKLLIFLDLIEKEKKVSFSEKNIEDAKSIRELVDLIVNIIDNSEQ